MPPSEERELEKAFSVLPNIKKVEPAPPSGPKPKHLNRGTERKLSRARQANPRRLPTVQGDDSSKTKNAVFYGVRFGEGGSNLLTELVPPKIETPPILPAINKSGELVCRGRSSEDLEVCEPKPPVATNQQPNFRRKFKPSKQQIDINNKPTPPKPKPPTAPSSDSSKSGNFRRRMYKLY